MVFMSETTFIVMRELQVQQKPEIVTSLAGKTGNGEALLTVALVWCVDVPFQKTKEYSEKRLFPNGFV